MSCVVCGTGLVDCSAGLSSSVKDTSSKHMNILHCWYFLALTELSKLRFLKRVNIFLMDDGLKQKATVGHNSGSPARSHLSPNGEGK